jgi:ABC-type phosphate transport system auxiliary subunit
LHSLETTNSRLQSELLTIQLEKQKVEIDRVFLFNRDQKSQELIASLTHQLSVLKEETSTTINRQNVENSQLKESNRQLKVHLDDLSSEYEMKLSDLKSKYHALEKETSFHRKQVCPNKLESL